MPEREGLRAGRWQEPSLPRLPALAPPCESGVSKNKEQGHQGGGQEQYGEDRSDPQEPAEPRWEVGEHGLDRSGTVAGGRHQASVRA